MAPTRSISSALTEDALAPYRFDEVSVVMQSAMASLNPVIRLGEQFTGRHPYP